MEPLVTAPIEFLGVPLFDDDIYKLLVRFLADIVFVTLLIRLAYYPHQKKKTYVFAFVMMNVMVFFLCFTLKKMELGLGMALGLFAVFGILRYRTDTIKVKEMTYLFLVVGIAVVNALSNKKASYSELLFTNFMILFSAILMERLCLIRKLAQQTLVYDKLELLRPENKAQLLQDLQARTGLDVRKVDVKQIDLPGESATITAFFHRHGHVH
jgi:hypothetical protein